MHSVQNYNSFTVRVMESKTIRLVEHVARVDDMRNLYKSSVARAAIFRRRTRISRD
jgi:hypothetical protein